MWRRGSGNCRGGAAPAVAAGDARCPRGVRRTGVIVRAGGVIVMMRLAPAGGGGRRLVMGLQCGMGACAESRRMVGAARLAARPRARMISSRGLS